MATRPRPTAAVYHDQTGARTPTDAANIGGAKQIAGGHPDREMNRAIHQQTQALHESYLRPLGTESAPPSLDMINAARMHAASGCAACRAFLGGVQAGTAGQRVRDLQLSQRAAGRDPVAWRRGETYGEYAERAARIIRGTPAETGINARIAKAAQEHARQERRSH